jgi:maltooligosyltrehalose trehalohydrolase
MLFQGEEWGASTPFQFFTDHRESELAKAVGIGRCKEFEMFGWKPEEIPDPQDRETFLRSKLKWQEISKSQHREILDWHKKLIQLRRREKDLTGGDLNLVEINFSEEDFWLTIRRNEIVVACNLKDKSQSVPIGRRGSVAEIHGGAAAPPCQILLASELKIKVEQGTVHLPAESVAIIRRK